MKIAQTLLSTCLGLLLGSVSGVWLVSTLFFSAEANLPEKQPTVLRVATYNVHYIAARRETGAWSVSDWERRREPFSEAITLMDADIIGFQEMETFGGDRRTDDNLTLTWLRTEHPEYSVGAVGNPIDFPSTQPILFLAERFTLEDEGWFFFSPTPDIIYARSYNGAYPAFASWVALNDTQNQQRIKVMNIHTDFLSYSNRRQSLALVRERITPWLAAGETVLLIGDFNAWRGSQLLDSFTPTGLTFAPVTAATYHFNRGLQLFPAIDHIAYSNSLVLASPPVVLQRRFSGIWPSDHYPVVVDLNSKLITQ